MTYNLFSSPRGSWKGAILLALFLLASCKPQKAETQENDKTEQTTDEVRSMPAYAYSDSLTQGSHKVVYSIMGESDDELPIIVDEDGSKHKDNRWKLVITKDGKQLFNHSFTKADFKSQLSEDFRKYGVMDGLRFHHDQEGKLYFNTCVSYPDSDMSCPFFLIIGPDGSYRIEPNTTIDEDDLPPAPDQPEEEAEA